MVPDDLLMIFKNTHYSIREKKREIQKVELTLWQSCSFFVAVFVAGCLMLYSSQKADTIRLAISFSLSFLSLSPPPPSLLTFTLCHLHTLAYAHNDGIKKTAFWWINLYILEPIPVSAHILQRPCLLLSWVPLQPSGVISLLAVLNSLIICVLHKKRTIPQWHTTACSAWLGFALMCIGCCVVSAIGFFRLSFSISLWRWDKMSVFLLLL